MTTVYTDTPIMVRFFISERPDEHLESMPFMFWEDIHHRVMPYVGLYSNEKETGISLSGEVQEIQRAMTVLGSLGRSYQPNQPPRLICDAVREVARRLAWDGNAHYEILRKEPTAGFSLAEFTSAHLYGVPRHYVQVVPRAERARVGRTTIWIPKHRVWHLQIPDTLGGPLQFKRMIKRMKAVSSLGPVFWTHDPQIMGSQNPFDWRDYRDRQELFFSKLTSTWGWPKRDYSIERITEAYLFYRMLTFNWAVAILREHITGELNHLFRRLSILSEISLGTLPRSFDIIELREKMLQGVLSFGEAHKRSSCA